MVNRDDFDDDFDDDDAFDYKPISSHEKGSSKGLKVIIALSVLGAIGAGAWYFIGQSSDDGSDIPLVRAETAPIKERPNEPGGMNVPNRDKTVYNRLSGEEASPKVERLLPPPEQPLEKPSTSMAIPELSETVSDQTGQPAITKDLPAAPENVSEPTVASEPAPPPQPSLPATPTEEMAEAVTPPEPAQTDPNAPRALIKRDAQSPMAQQDKAGLEEKIAEALAENINQESETQSDTPVAPAREKPTPSEPAKPIETSAIEDKGYMLQLLSSKNEPAVKREWEKIQARNGDILMNTPAKIVKADLGADKGIYYRLRLGPFDGSTPAKDMCNQLKKRDVGCFIVRVQ